MRFPNPTKPNLHGTFLNQPVKGLTLENGNCRKYFSHCRKTQRLHRLRQQNTKLIQSLGGKRVTELDWWQETQVELEGSAQVVKVSVVPAQHWSKRGLFDTNKALWGGFVLQTSKAKIYFSGDTGYAGFFKSIFEKYGPMDLSIIAIGAYEPRWFMKEQHMNPAEAVQAHMDLHSKRTLGTHFGTFQLTDEAIDEPKLALERDLTANKILKGVFTAPDNGETLKLNVE
ncbi:MAG: hypothetical protein EOO02_15130 [Chitinophagaceae bacterium]|nr:MAG: hypothetical protein EOO02_15130 [Chitinophagaceae bacterium]